MLNKLFEISARRADGSEFPIELFMVTLKDNTEDIYCAFIRDITDRKKPAELNKVVFTLASPVGSPRRQLAKGL